jgi:DNA repair exonuclease SbcCD ATPase subunit
MSVLVENIKRISGKLQQLLKQYQLLQKENEQLKGAISELKASQENDLQRISQLEQQVGILKSAAGKMNEVDRKIYEKQINQYIREIDKCIGLLSE